MTPSSVRPAYLSKRPSLSRDHRRDKTTRYESPTPPPHRRSRIEDRRWSRSPPASGSHNRSRPSPDRLRRVSSSWKASDSDEGRTPGSHNMEVGPAEPVPSAVIAPPSLSGLPLHHTHLPPHTPSTPPTSAPLPPSLLPPPPFPAAPPFLSLTSHEPSPTELPTEAKRALWADRTKQVPIFRQTLNTFLIPV